MYSMGVEYIQADITASYTDTSTTEAPAQRPSLCDGEGHLIVQIFHDEGEAGTSYAHRFVCAATKSRNSFTESRSELSLTGAGDLSGYNRWLSRCSGPGRGGGHITTGYNRPILLRPLAQRHKPSLCGRVQYQARAI